ncbi:GIY-YIG nuclease family protein [Kitasatospora sp. NPDC087271]|uniref:GIY-YIG nuclease family protein n=1 Tax=Kitasatospora sp. NPDC087271 TaxID=3364067 RepID=UPI00381390FC
MAVYKYGFVYVMVNPAMPDLVKIGWSEHLPEDRAEGLSKTAVPFPFQVAYRAKTLRHREVERQAHRLLAAARVAPNREFFRVSVEDAVGAVRLAQEQVTGIDSWTSSPERHLVGRGDRVVLPLKSGQVFVLTAYPEFLSTEPHVLDIWQAHTDGDVLEIDGADHPGHVAGLSDGDPGGDEDPVPFLDRSGEVQNGTLIGRERLVSGDRLIWLADTEDPAHCACVVFEADSACQIACRTWNPQSNPFGVPLLLNDLVRDPSPAMVEAAKKVLDLRRPRTWAPRSPDPDGDWAIAATLPQPPEYWLPQLLKRRPQT